MARLYADENFPRPVVEALRTLGHDVLTVQETRTVGAAMPDREVLSFAIAQERAVLTINRRDFIRLHAADPAHAGIIVCTLDLDFAGQAARIDAAVSAHPELRGLLIRVNRPA